MISRSSFLDFRFVSPSCSSEDRCKISAWSCALPGNDSRTKNALLKGVPGSCGGCSSNCGKYTQSAGLFMAGCVAEFLGPMVSGHIVGHH